MAKAKNLLFLHLESISRTNLWQYRNELGTVWRLMSESLQFNRFFTTSTSTDMTMTDLIYGDSSVKDASPTYQTSKAVRNMPGFSRYFDWPRPNHNLYTFHSSPYSRASENVGPAGAYLNLPDLPAMCERSLQHLAKCKHDGRNFIAYFWDDSSHLAFVSQYKEQAKSVAERMRVAYALVDASLNRLLSGLIELGLWDDTIIIGFGDHGDEAWSHGLNRGYCHSLPPYASLVWTPMFIFHPKRFAPGITGQLASMVDLKDTAHGLLFPDAPPPARNTPFAGVDLFREKREFAFSQNMFALQREYSDPEQGMVKGYAVTDGNYRLLAHSGGKNRGEGGLALYCDQADPANSLNLLRFFRLGREGDIRGFSPPPDAVAKHFTGTFGSAQVEELGAAYARLRETLRNFVRDKEDWALRQYEAILNGPIEELARRQASSFRDGSSPPESFVPGCLALRQAFKGQAVERFPMDAFNKVRKVD